MKLFQFFKTKNTQVEEKTTPIELNSGSDIFEKIQLEFISKATNHAEKIVRAFNTKYDGAFDYSIRSLNILDSLIEDFADFTDLSDEEIINDFSTQAGSYILEVARRNFGGVYFWEDNLRQPMLKTGFPDFEITLLTYNKVKNRIINGEEDNIPYFFKRYSEKVRKAAKGDNVTFE
ncbi:hypothetical protein D3C87_396410 [compost metagenome]